MLSRQKIVKSSGGRWPLGRWWLAAAGWWLMTSGQLAAQDAPPGAPVVTYANANWACKPLAAGSAAPASCPNNASGTIATTGTFQSVFSAAKGNRRACSIQNNGTNNMEVFPGPPAVATTGASVVLLPGWFFYCSTTSGGVLQDQISITGTSADVFYASQQ